MVPAAKRDQLVVGNEQDVAVRPVVDLEQRGLGASLALLAVRAATSVTGEDAGARPPPCPRRPLRPARGVELAARAHAGRDRAAALEARSQEHEPRAPEATGCSHGAVALAQRLLERSSAAGGLFVPCWNLRRAYLARMTLSPPRSKNLRYTTKRDAPARWWAFHRMRSMYNGRYPAARRAGGFLAELGQAAALPQAFRCAQFECAESQVSLPDW
jgi:hypothetical protein